jgi:rubrerythrin
MAIAREKASYAHLAAAAQASTCPKAKRLYNQLALDELRHLLGLVSLMDSFSDDCLTQLDLSFPAGDRSESLPRNDDHLLDTAIAEEQQSQAFFGALAERVNREELAAFLELLREEEAGHLVRLQSLLYGFEADRPVIAKWLRSIRRSAPTASLH